MTILKKIRVLAAKVETTPGTAETLTAAEAAFNAYGVMFQPTIAVDPRPAQGQFGSLHGVSGARQGKATFRTDIGWSGTGIPSWASVFLPACGWVNNGSGVFTPRSEAPGTNVKTLTLACYMNGMRKMLVGAVGTFTMVCPAGRLAAIDWEFTGVWVTPTDTAILSPTYPADTPIRFASSTVAWGSESPKVESLTFNAGNVIHLREDPSTVQGYSSGIITDRSPRITCNPEAVLVATHDRHGEWTSHTEAAFSAILTPNGSDTLTIAAAKAQLLNNQEGDRGGLVADQVELGCNINPSAANAELTLTFAEVA